MAYNATNGRRTLLGYLGITESDIEFIPDTNDRGFVYKYNGGDKCVIYIYPISHKADNTKNFFDTRDSGAKERCVTWNYAVKNNHKYFCFAVNDEVTKYKDYIFSLESDEKSLQDKSGGISLDLDIRERSGSQVVIPNNFIPSKDYEKLITTAGFHLAVINKNKINEYLTYFDNRSCNAINWTVGTKIDFSIKYNNDYKKNRIVFGAPGTGKSYRLESDKNKLLRGTNGSFERVTFHQDYSYSQFVGTYKPVMEGKDISYEFVPGPFIRVYVDAIRSLLSGNPQPHVLIIEEINRAKTAAVFGDIFQLLDRDSNGISEYEIQVSADLRKHLKKELGGVPDDYKIMRIPSNMFIWSTMNSADQGVFPMDTAFKRRWSFEYIGVNDEEYSVDKVTSEKYNNVPGDFVVSGKRYSWNILRRAINAKLSDEQVKAHEDKLIGPFFLKTLGRNVDSAGQFSDNEEFLKDFESKVLMYLYEDAAKTKRSQLFGEWIKKCDRYSFVCDKFRNDGLKVFGDDFENKYYSEQKSEAEDKWSKM